jgi:hypothetical protein
MRCNVFHVNQTTGAETLNNVRHTDELTEANGFSDEEADAMEAALRATGEFRIGGGAAPLFVIRPVRPQQPR